MRSTIIAWILDALDRGIDIGLRVTQLDGAARAPRLQPVRVPVRKP